jgi:hypothetical protein
LKPCDSSRGFAFAAGLRAVIRDRRGQLADLPGDGQVDVLPRCIRERNIPAVMRDPLHPVQIEGFKRMSPAQKLQMVCDLYQTGIQLRVAGLRTAHPDWSPERLDFEARRSLLHAGT